MKFNKEIITEFNTIYDVEVARGLYSVGKYTARTLSLMKQENIIISAKSNKCMGNIQEVVENECGYCFKYRNGISCKKCPLYKKRKCQCFVYSEYYMMKGDISRTEFLESHKRWCMKLGLLQKGWK